MRTGFTHEMTTPHVLKQPLSLQGAREPDVPRCELPARNSDSPAGHDASLLIAAMEGLEAQRAAIEWLWDADLLRFCLI